MKRPRVLHVAVGAPPFASGDAAECVAGLARALEARGVPSVVVAPRPRATSRATGPSASGPCRATCSRS